MASAKAQAQDARGIGSRGKSEPGVGHGRRFAKGMAARKTRPKFKRY